MQVVLEPNLLLGKASSLGVLHLARLRCFCLLRIRQSVSILPLIVLILVVTGLAWISLILISQACSISIQPNFL